MPVSVLTLNTWVEPQAHEERTEDLVAYIKQSSPDVVMLQECFTATRKHILRAELKADYHVFFSGQSWPYTPAEGYLLTALFAVLSALAWAAGGPASWAATPLACLSILLFPRTLAMIAKVLGWVLVCGSSYSVDGDIPLTDWTAQAVLVRRGAFPSAELVIAKPFRDKAYPPPRSIGAFLAYYILQTPLLCPGFLVVRCGEIVFASVHAGLGYVNPLRKRQLEELHEHVGDYSEVFVAGDFNAPPEQPEMRSFCSIGYRDAVSEFAGRSWDTWDNSNPMVRHDPDEPDAQIDYIFYKGSAHTLEHVERVFDGTKTKLVSDHYGLEARFA